MPREDRILFLDLETTGNTPEDEIVEVGLVLMDWPSMKTHAETNIVVQPSDLGMYRLLGGEWTSKYLRENGLIDEIEQRKATSNLVSLDRDVLDWLTYTGTTGNEHIPLAGSGVSHFDRQYLKLYTPVFNKRLTYWAYDVGVMRRMFILAGAPVFEDDGKTHRALDDARVHVNEFRYYIHSIQALKEFMSGSDGLLDIAQFVTEKYVPSNPT